MTLLENLVAALLFTSVATASLGIWSLGLAGEANRAQRERSLDRLDAELNRLDLRLRAAASAVTPLPDCGAALTLLAAVAEQEPPAEGLMRQLNGDPDGEGLTVTLIAAGRPEQRQRWFSPAALGLCGGWGGTDATR